MILIHLQWGVTRTCQRRDDADLTWKRKGTAAHENMFSCGPRDNLDRRCSGFGVRDQSTGACMQGCDGAHRGAFLSLAGFGSTWWCWVLLVWVSKHVWGNEILKLMLMLVANNRVDYLKKVVQIFFFFWILFFFPWNWKILTYVKFDLCWNINYLVFATRRGLFDPQFYFFFLVEYQYEWSLKYIENGKFRKRFLY